MIGGFDLRKYWKMLLICCVIVIILPAFYVYSKTNDSQLTYKIKTVKGNEQEIENIAFKMTYQNNIGNVGYVDQEVQISKEGTKEVDKQSFLGISLYSDRGEYFSKYIQAYRSYMRGKQQSPNVYYEDKERLVYSNIVERESEFLKVVQVDILNKQTNDRLTFEVDAPKVQGYINVQNINMQKGRLDILVNVFGYAGEAELHIYTIDIENKKLINDELLYQSVQKEGISSNMYVLNDADALQNEMSYVYGIENRKVSENGTEQVVSQELYMYDTQTKQQKKVALPFTITDNMYSDMVMDDGDIVLFGPAKSGLEVWRYDVVKEKWSKLNSFKNIVTMNDQMGNVQSGYFEESVTNEGMLNHQSKNGKLYVINYTLKGLSLFIVDLKTGTLLYEGQFVGGDTARLNSYFEVVNGAS